MSGKEGEYGRKMAVIEAKFKLICEKYEQVTLELRSKDDSIARMARQIEDLQSKLETAKETIAELEKQIRKSELLHKTYYLRHKANVESNELIESQPSSTNLYSRLKDLKSGVKSEVINQRLSQDSIVPEQLKQKNDGHKRDSIESTISRLKAKIASKPHIPTPGSANSQDQAQAAPHPSLLRIKSMESIKNGEAKESLNIKTLQRIWQQRDTQIEKMDELFESLNSKLKDYGE